MIIRTITPALSCLLLPILWGCAMPGNRPDNTAPRGYVALFNGKDLTGWQGSVNPKKRAAMSPDELADAQERADQKMRAHWIVHDGVLMYDGKGSHLSTIKHYGNFDLLIDWKIAPKGDSGLYLRGVPQVQIWDRPDIGSGGLFNNKVHPSEPARVADNPVGEWNRFRIRMVGDKVTVWLNGKRVVDNVTMENFWNPEAPMPAKGPIELQHHGDPLWFKNIYIRELR